MKYIKVENKKINHQKLLEYGFLYNNSYIYSKNIFNNEFILDIKISKNGELKANITEKSTNEPYTLHLIDGINGSFVGQIRKEFEECINEIIDLCYDTDVFKEKTTFKIINYIQKKYNDMPEYLWEKFPRNAVFRRKDNKKWYAAILTAKKCKIGVQGDEIAEIIDLRANTEDIPYLIKKNYIYPGYHMNKKHWITIVLDKSAPVEKVYEMIDVSYNIAAKK